MRADEGGKSAYIWAMPETTLIDRLLALKPELERRGVASLYLFGSQLRGEGSPDSDIDLYFDRRGRMSLLDVIGIRQFLEEELQARVDLMTRDSLSPLLRADIEAESIPVF